MNETVIFLPARRQYWANHINTAWRETLNGIFETGRRLIQAKSELPGQFEAMVATDLLFGPRTARRLMQIARNWEYRFRTHASVLPPSWMSLYELTKLTDAEYGTLIDDRTIRPDVEREEIVARCRALRRNAREVAHRCEIVGGLVDDLWAFIDAGHRVGTIYADPPWLYDNQVTRSATRNIYDGMTVDELRELPVGELASDDAHLHLWTTNAFLFECPKLFRAWDFEFKSTFVWVKSVLGIGNYWRNSHEILLTAIRGDATRFADHNLRSWLECRRGKHSGKPEQVRDYIERASPGPWLELFARHPAPNWLSWGHEIRDSLLSHGMGAIE